MFADDTLIYMNDGDSKELKHKMSMVFNIIEQWLNVNKLKMNAEKTKYMKSIRKEQRSEMF